MPSPGESGKFERIEEHDAPGADVADEQARAVAAIVAADRNGREFARQHDRLRVFVYRHRESDEEKHVGERLIVIEQQNLFESYLEAAVVGNQLMDGIASP